MLVIPAIHLIEGRAVELPDHSGVPNREICSVLPLDLAKKIEDVGLSRVHVVDLDGVRERKIINYKVVERLARWTSLAIDLRAGIQNERDLAIAFDCGVRQANVDLGSLKNAENFSSWCSRFGGEQLIVGAEIRAGKITAEGWSELSEAPVMNAFEKIAGQGGSFVRFAELSSTGVLMQPERALCAEIAERLPKLNCNGWMSVKKITDIEAATQLPLYAVTVDSGSIATQNLLPMLRSLLEVKP